jgi:hypothetical protein
MNAFLTSVAVALALAIGVAYMLDGTWQRRAADAYTTSGARIDDPGHNLVGKDWYRGQRS